MEWVELSAWIKDVGSAVAIGLLIVTSVVRGWLVPGVTVDRLVQAANTRAEEWKAVAQAAQARAEQADAQASILLAELGTQTQLLQAIRQEAARRRDP